MRPVKQQSGAPSGKPLWPIICAQAAQAAAQDPVMSLFLRYYILGRKNLPEALAVLLVEHLQQAPWDKEVLLFCFTDILTRLEKAETVLEADLRAVMERDPAAGCFMNILLYYKGFHALQTHRIAHALWQQGHKDFARYVQNRSSCVFQTDMHPAAQIGKAVFIDHATGLVIGETVIIEDNVSLLHEVTLGSTGKNSGNRHPKIRCGVLVGAGAKILGNIEIGAFAKIAANSVVLKAVPSRMTAAGVPARIIGKSGSGSPAADMDQSFVYGDGEAI